MANPSDRAALSSTLLERLQIEPGEVAVATLAAQLRDGEQVLRFGSVLVGPPQLAQMSWPEWHAAETGRGPSPFESLFESAGRPLGQWAHFDEVVQDWRLLRFPLDVADLGAWLDQAVHHGVVDVPSGLALRARLEIPSALVRVFPHHETATGRLTAMASRALVGWLHPAAVVDGEAAATPPEQWRLSPGSHIQASTLFLTGLSVSDDSTGRPIRPGLLVGRMQTRAWITQLRGSEDLTAFDVSLRLDPARCSLWELVLDLEEYDDAGDLLWARRVALSDLVVPEHGPERFTVSLPTLGRRLVRRVRLYDREGILLDSADGVRLIETVEVVVRIMDGPIVSGPPKPALPAPDLRSRVQAMDNVEEQYRELLRSGVDSRVVVSRATGRAELRKRLAAARGELLVVDPYFGDADDDWSLLHDLSIPVRVLASRKALLPAGTTARLPRLDVRRWNRAATPPYHDRAYLWSGGGLTVGASANGLGLRLTLIDALEPAVAAHLGQLFEAWWNDPRFTHLPESRGLAGRQS